jgi:hypothetical protein
MSDAIYVYDAELDVWERFPQLPLEHEVGPGVKCSKPSDPNLLFPGFTCPHSEASLAREKKNQ